MAPSYKALVLFALQIIAFAQAKANSVNITADDGSIQTLTFVGTVEGKSYFVEPTPMTWLQAEELCTKSKLKLGSILTQPQAQLLKDALGKEFHFQHFWTSGKESRTPQSIVWSGTNIHPNTSLATFKYYPGDYPNHYCQVVWSNLIQNWFVLEVQPCTNPRGVLCET